MQCCRKKQQELLELLQKGLAALEQRSQPLKCEEQIQQQRLELVKELLL